MEIVAELAQDRTVERMLEKIAGRAPLTGDLADLAQDVYLILLTYDEDKIRDLYENKQMNFFVARILTNQYRSTTSPFYTIYRKPHEETVRLRDNIPAEDGTR